MDLIKISHLTKTYKTSGKTVNVLKDVNLTLPEAGLVAILGKSGSGKSTLLNILGNIDKPSKGNVVFSCNHKRSSPNISFIFQHYCLLENETPLFNVMLPGLIQGYDKKMIEHRARELLNSFELGDELINKETRLLSGGEKERIAILRALITNPRVILADEPTGALDINNAIKTMEILKKSSESRLVLLVTHNKTLAEQYADRIITLSDGKIIDDKIINKTNEEVYRSNVKTHYRNNWTTQIIEHNFRKRIKRNLVSCLGMTISLTFCYLLFGFSNKANSAINEVSTKHFDYGTSTIRKELRTKSDSSISLVKTVRPSQEDIDEMQIRFPEFEFMNNYDAVFNSGELYIGNEISEEISNSFVYSFSSTSIDRSLVIAGDISKARFWNDVVMNGKAYEMIGKKDVHYKINYENIFKGNNSKEIIDYFDIDEELKVVAVVDEFDFLSTPKVYFDYQKIEDLFSSKFLENYSDYIKENITWGEYIESASQNDDITSYSLKCFIRNISDKDKVEKLSNYLTEEIKLENDSLSIKDALLSLTSAASIGLNIFLVIALIGSSLILGVFSFSAYSDDRKESSILSCLGAKDSDVIGIFTSESLIVCFLSFLFSTVLSWLLQMPLALLLETLIGIPNLIEIPFKTYLKIRGFLPLSVLVITSTIAILFSAIPILINKKSSLKKELSDL